MIASGPPADVAVEMRAALDRGASRVVAFEDDTGRQIDFDLRGAADEIRSRLTAPPREPARTGRGRPKLGVVAREVTLLPRHWEWLSEQSGGASATLRRLVDDARRATLGDQEAKLARDVTYRLMSGLGGDLPLFEDAARALFAGDFKRVREVVGTWPTDIASYIAAHMPQSVDTLPSGDGA